MIEITPLPDFPLYMKGVISVRGEMVPMLDLRLRLGNETIPSHTYRVFGSLKITTMNKSS